jgi:hypothetical protein
MIHIDGDSSPGPVNDHGEGPQSTAACEWYSCAKARHGDSKTTVGATPLTRSYRVGTKFTPARSQVGAEADSPPAAEKT